jgi:hypothetical protein
MDSNRFIKSIMDFLKKHWQGWTILAILVMIVYLGLTLYNYVYKPLYQPEKVVLEQPVIKESLYKSLMDNFAQRQKSIIEIFGKNYLDPFK